MLKLRLKRAGRKGSPSYRLVIIEQSTRRDGRPIYEVGYYNPITKQSFFNILKIETFLRNGVKPSKTVLNLLLKANIIQL
jgi:small subunit ribosomal protein S16